MPGQPIPSCVRCGRPQVQNPITLEFTCFEHGRPDGSERERQIWQSGGKLNAAAWLHQAMENLDISRGQDESVVDEVIAAYQAFKQFEE